MIKYLSRYFQKSIKLTICKGIEKPKKKLQAQTKQNNNRSNKMSMSKHEKRRTLEIKKGDLSFGSIRANPFNVLCILRINQRDKYIDTKLTKREITNPRIKERRFKL